MSSPRVYFGLLIWIIAGLGFWRSVDARRDVESVRAASGGDQTRGLMPTLWDYATAAPRRVMLEIPEPVQLSVGDPILLGGVGDLFDLGAVRQVGQIKRVLDPDTHLPVHEATTRTAEALFYASAPTVTQRVRLTYYEMPDSLAWVVETLLPAEKKRRVAREIRAAIEAHHVEVLASLRPVVEQSLREGFAILEQDLADALERHRAEFERLGDKYQREIVEAELVPLVKQEIWPAVRRHAEPTAAKVGQEIWQRASLWRFGWRYAHDTMPLTSGDLVEREWARFVDAEAIPVLEKHTDDFVVVVQKVVAEALENDEVRSVVKRNLAEIAADPELQQLLWQISREVVIDNARLADAIQQHWSSPEARRAMVLAAERLEPTIRRVGRLIFQSDDGGLSPEFTRVLRNRLLGKDQRFLVLEQSEEPFPPAGSGSQIVLRVRRGSGDARNPFTTSQSSARDDRLQ